MLRAQSTVCLTFYLFTLQLRLMLDNETVADSGSIQWLDGEDAFIILDQNKFEKVCSAKVVASCCSRRPSVSICTRLHHCILYPSTPCLSLFFNRILSPNILLQSSSKVFSASCIDGVSRGLLPHMLVVTSSLLPLSREVLLLAQR